MWPFKSSSEIRGADFELGLERVSFAEYAGSSSRRVYVRSKRFFEECARAEIVGGKSSPYGFATTRVRKGGWFGAADEHLLAVDCDCEEDVRRASLWFRDVSRLGHRIIQSSPGHFWVVSDFQGTWSEVARRLVMVPGADPFWVKHCLRYGNISLRAIPGRAADLPDFELEEEDTLANPSAWEWVRSLQAHFMAPEMVSVLERWRSLAHRLGTLPSGGTPEDYVAVLPRQAGSDHRDFEWY